MIKCVRIVAKEVVTKTFITAAMKAAQRLGIEGVLHAAEDDTMRIVACGSRENIEAFLDVLYKQGVSLEVEPFLKDKDYRGVFRIIQ